MPVNPQVQYQDPNAGRTRPPLGFVYDPMGNLICLDPLTAARFDAWKAEKARRKAEEELQNEKNLRNQQQTQQTQENPQQGMMSMDLPVQYQRQKLNNPPPRVGS